MKEENKIPISDVRKAVESYKKFVFTDRQWDTGLAGWRKQHKFHTAKTAKGWIKDFEALSLVRYLTFPTAQILLGEDYLVIL